MTYFGQEYPIDIYNPDVDPIARKECYSDMRQDGVNPCLEKAAANFCDRLWPAPNNCVKDITLHITSQIKSTDEKRLDAKCSYKRLGLEMDAPGYELYHKAAAVARERKMNMSPFRRVDNGTIPHSWTTETSEAYAAIDTFQKIHDAESREWNDKPCVPCKFSLLCAVKYNMITMLPLLTHKIITTCVQDFGGALCAKTDKDGNMMIGTCSCNLLFVAVFTNPPK